MCKLNKPRRKNKTGMNPRICNSLRRKSCSRGDVYSFKHDSAHADGQRKRYEGRNKDVNPVEDVQAAPDLLSEPERYK